MKITLKLSTFLFLGLFGLMANAVTINVSEIRITPSALNTDGWLQISEVVATETGTGNDLALASAGASTAASSNWTISGPSDESFTIDGNGPSAFPFIFHSNENDGTSFLSVFLASPSSLDSVTIFGRTDTASYRDIYNLTLLDSSGAVLFSAADLDGTNGAITSNLGSSAAVPLPAAIWFFGTAILGLIGMKRRKS